MKYWGRKRSISSQEDKTVSSPFPSSTLAREKNLCMLGQDRAGLGQIVLCNTKPD